MLRRSEIEPTKRSNSPRMLSRGSIDDRQRRFILDRMQRQILRLHHQGLYAHQVREISLANSAYTVTLTLRMVKTLSASRFK